jgi:four helix bundle protein
VRIDDRGMYSKQSISSNIDRTIRNIDSVADYTQLKVWQRSKDLAVKIYKLTNDGDFSKDFRFRDQIRSAAVSVPSNIAEGDELGTNKQSIRHFLIAKGSIAEVVTQLTIASEIRYIGPSEFEEIKSDYQHVTHMLSKIIRIRRSKDSKD